MKIPEREHYRDYHEVKEHAGKEFPFNIYPCSIPLDFPQVGVHWHEELEIIAVKKGCAAITVDTVFYEVWEGEAIVVFPGQLHGIGQKNAQTVEYENIIFLPHMLESGNQDLCTQEFLMPLMEETACRPLHIKRDLTGYKKFSEFISQLDDLGRDRPFGYQLAVKGLLFQFLYLIFRGNYWKPAEKPKKSRERMKQLLGYIEDHYGEKITIEDAAAMCYYSNSHFMKYFKQYMGMPFTEYLNDYRMIQAGRLLLASEEPVTAVAQKCGFDNISYFNRLFRQKYQTAPGKYRKNNGVR